MIDKRLSYYPKRVLGKEKQNNSSNSIVSNTIWSVAVLIAGLQNVIIETDITK